MALEVTVGLCLPAPLPLCVTPPVEHHHDRTAAYARRKNMQSLPKRIGVSSLLELVDVDIMKLKVFELLGLVLSLTFSVWEQVWVTSLILNTVFPSGDETV